MAVIPLVQIARADHQSTSIETGGRGFHLVIHARFFYTHCGFFLGKMALPLGQTKNSSLQPNGSDFGAITQHTEPYVMPNLTYFHS